MKILFIIVFITLINYTFCYINKGKFFELDKADEKAYLVVENCEKVYICNIHSKAGLFGLYGDDILDGYEGNFNNPIKCSLIRYAYVSTEACFMTNNGKNKIKGKYNSLETAYYDIDIYNNRLLTEMGWCTYLYEHIDVHWMSYINPDLKINQINLPGTHDTGTYNITKVKKNTNILSQLLDFYIGLPKALLTQTQDLDITEQLKNGIRYFDIRLDLNKKTDLLYLTHNGVDCYDSKNEDYLYFESVLKYCVDFLIEHPSETVILHLKIEHYAKEEADEIIAGLIESVIPKNYNEDSTYLDYVYIPNNIDAYFTNKYMPNLGEVKGRIVFLSRSIFYYKNVKKITPEYDFSSSDTFPIGFIRNITDKKCSTFPLPLVFSMDDENCKPEVKNNYRVQDNYQLEVKIKWDYVEKMLTDKSKFNDKNNNLTHTLNFMNVAFLNNLPIPMGSMYINKQLTDFLKKNSAPNEWFILDFPTIDVIREIYNSNFDENRPVYKPNKSNDMNLDSIIKEKNKKDNLIACIMTFNFACIFGNSDDSDDSHSYAGRRDITNKELDEKSFVCLQRKIITDEQGNKQDIVKFDYKCVDNNLNKWHIEESNDGKFYSIVSSYDDKCLNYSGDTLHMQECKNNNKYQEFTIKDDIICSRIDATKCLNGVKCCSNQNTQVQYVDEIGNWGIENGNWGIGYERCSFSILGYKCCFSVNPEVKFTDNNGSWGYEDDTNILLMGDCNHSEWTYQNEKFVLEATGKCLYTMNSQNAKMIECSKADDQINHHIHFKIIDNKYICIKNNVDPSDYCLNGSTLNFETNKIEYFVLY
ncbi:PLC-like phosphodiesterase [Anaeromyces robustus]|uniref:PLC-like phosphodiesterase n=1 Tax=Anaeromyces robustus TaxID=1754192 RepID=A0A1Y1VSI5_9FUNG|nr:PLC-like phosphodiesterase [Anaeromyces robustus]|eukprot:ORX64261.1 PLC-like phosphodiesterase [Anaeromyces robustus]